MRAGPAHANNLQILRNAWEQQQISHLCATFGQVQEVQVDWLRANATAYKWDITRTPLPGNY
jgi:hypothetical protein